jgi:RNA polymerase sigma-70 factor (ECF subfamily)
MRFWDELPVPEIAAVLGCTPNAASIRIHRAKQRLAGQLVGSAGNEDEEVAR